MNLGADGRTITDLSKQGCGSREYRSTSRNTLSCPRLVARSVRPPSGTVGQWYDKPNFHTMAPPLRWALTGLHMVAQPG
eukprot:362816-Chlamydomonas_euryale.AAC.5